MLATVWCLFCFVCLGLAQILPPGYQTQAKPGLSIILLSRRVCSATEDRCNWEQLMTSTDGTSPLFCEFNTEGPERQAIENTKGAEVDVPTTPCHEADNSEIVRLWGDQDAIKTIIAWDANGKLSWRALAEDGTTWLNITRFMPASALGSDDSEQIFQSPPELVRSVPRSNEDSLDGKKGQDPGKMSFFDKPCEGSNWGVSWGYNAEAEEDVATMTLTNEKRDRRAFFGFRYINDNTRLGDRGPEKTEKY
ncbi:uncharacterized protein VDAG_08481 [Verticillium dahliae VdLs.17]|uniref:Uncharacterized protein n=1 Tax=Verticillium dahliae (strain VdLs.17 / ATCC MYA-4575 / FGSC 10137) TaxID=498257 RepID=G2XE99_VERDV|nr:uncharacterized protein VDAG_08481 [Verticillium dahliae VdLs.17]EGY18147.1 hypothetical protein VDAG_08481 [Verticillium dahliae VdLs.17]